MLIWHNAFLFIWIYHQERLNYKHFNSDEKTQNKARIIGWKKFWFVTGMF